METSKVFGVLEECHSSESGWTMYIGSPAGDDDDDDGHSYDRDYDDDYDGGRGSDDMNANHEDDSDDSMASDASSGLSKPYGNVQVRHANISHFKGEEDKDDSSSKCGSDKKVIRQLKRQKAEIRRKEEKEDVFISKRRVSTSAQSDSKRGVNHLDIQSKESRRSRG